MEKNEKFYLDIYIYISQYRYLYLYPYLYCDWGFVLTFFSYSLRKNHVPGHLASWQMKRKWGFSTLNLSQPVCPHLHMVSKAAMPSRSGVPALSPVSTDWLGRWLAKTTPGGFSSLFWPPALAPHLSPQPLQSSHSFLLGKPPSKGNFLCHTLLEGREPALQSLVEFFTI